MDNFWLMQGDCLERMKEIPDNSVHLILSDIPYGIDYSEWDIKHRNTNSALMGASPAQKKSSNFKTRGKPKNGWSQEDRKRSQEFQDFCKDFLVECERVLKNAGCVICMTGRQFQHRFTCAAEESGIIFKETLAWNKMKAPMRAQRVGKVLERRGIDHSGNERLGCPAPEFEPIVVMFKPYPIGTTITDCFIKDGVGVFDADYIDSNILEISASVKSRQHETQKPVELMETLVGGFSREGHRVLDMFMGSGTTGVACANLNRKFIGIELDEDYYKIAEKRINDTLRSEKHGETLQKLASA